MTEHGVVIPAGASVRADRTSAAAPAAEAHDVAVVVGHVDSHDAVAAGRRRECDGVREGYHDGGRVLLLLSLRQVLLLLRLQLQQPPPHCEVRAGCDGHVRESGCVSGSEWLQWWQGDGGAAVVIGV